MNITQNVSDKVTPISDVEFDYTMSSDFNVVDSLNENCNAIVMEATVVYFEIKNLKVLLKTGKRLTARVYKIYYTTLKEVCNQTGGYLNCYSPESFLMIYPKDKHDASFVVDTALKTANLLSVNLRETIEKHSHINFAMGIDQGSILGTRTFVGNNLSQLVWFGNTIEKTITICNNCQRPFFVGISGSVFHHLDDSLKTTSKRILGIKKQVDIWNRMSYQFENVKKHLYQTNFHKSFGEDE